MNQMIVEPSIFPAEIDPLVFFSDADLDNYELLNQYYTLLDNHNYVEASSYIQSLETSQSGSRVSSVPYYGAWILNFYENMLFAIEDNMDQYVSPTLKPRLTFHSSTAPTDPEFKTWVYYDRSPGIPEPVTPPTPPAIMFENGQFSQDFVSRYYRFGSASAPEGTGVYETIRNLEMASYGKECYDASVNLYALGSSFQNLYSISNGNIVRVCNLGSSMSQNGCSVFIPLENLNIEYDTIQIEYKLENANSSSQIGVGVCILNGNAYQSVGTQSSNISGDWQTLELHLNQRILIKALELQTSYGNYAIRKIVLQ